MSQPTSRLAFSSIAPPFLAHLPVVVWLFGDSLRGRGVLYFRDIANLYYPAYVLLDRAFHAGIWPLWNPGNYAGAPFLMTNPIELLLVYVGGPAGALRFGPALYMAIAMTGASLLARALSLGPWGVWSAGLFYGLSGFVLSTVSLFPIFHAAAWAPWVVAAMLLLWRHPGAASAAGLALVTALQISTLSGELVLQTIVFGLVLMGLAASRKRCAALAGAAALSALIAAPALLGAWALVAGTARGQGFSPSEAFAWSLRPAALLDAVLPTFFGDVHTATGAGYWGQPFFSTGFPYLVSLYLGPGILLLAACARGPLIPRRLWVLVIVGVLFALGSHTPLAWAMQPLMRHFRSPVKFMFMSDLALCLLAASGLDSVTRGSRVRLAFVLPPAILLASQAFVLRLWPGLPARLFGHVLPEIASMPARAVAASSWPSSFGISGVLLLAVVLALRRPRLSVLAGVLVGLDLLLTNGRINTFAHPSFFELRPAIRQVIDEARKTGPDDRWFSFGAQAGTPNLEWASYLLQPNTDVWLYYFDRQALWPRTNIIDGLDSGFDEDAEGWAPQGASLAASTRVPARFSEYREALRRAGIRWVLSFAPLPEPLAVLRNLAPFPEIRLPLRLYEIVDARPRAYWSAEVADGEPVAGGAARVDYERPDPHTVRLRVHAPPGYVHVIEGFDEGWRVDSPGDARPLMRAGERYWAIRSSGDETITVRYRPRWRAPALALCALGLLAALGVLLTSAYISRRRAVVIFSPHQ